MSSKLGTLRLSAPNYNQVIIGKKITLKPVSQTEINETYVSWLNDSDINSGLISTQNFIYDIKSIVEYVNNIRSKQRTEIFAILYGDKSQHVGNIAITHFNEDNSRSLTYGLLIGDSSARSTGVGAKAIILLLNYIFKNFKEIEQINVSCKKTNRESYEFLTRLGFTNVGKDQLPKYIQTKYNQDSLCFKLSEENWNKKKEYLLTLI